MSECVLRRWIAVALNGCFNRARMRVFRKLTVVFLVAGCGAVCVGTSAKVAFADEAVASITAASNSTCAISTGGGLTCWGFNSDGQVGDGTNVNAVAPVGVVGLGAGVSSVSGAGEDTCALVASGAVKCWGFGGNGGLGNGGFSSSSVPVDVSGLGSGVAAVSVGGGNSCALTIAGGVVCWGDDSQGELGNGTTFT